MEGWLMNTEGKKLYKDISSMINVLGWTALYAICIYIGSCLWFAFRPEIQSAIRTIQEVLF